MRLPRLSVLMLSLASAVLLVAACSGGDDEASATSTVGAATEVASSTSTAEANATASSTSTAESTSTSEATSTSALEATSSSTSEATSTSTSEATASAESGDNDYETEIEDFAFEQGIAVPAGTTVRWKNRDGVPHTVTADDSSFDSGLLETNDTFEVVFDAAGAFTLHCNVHPTMTATITVQ